MEVQQVHLDSPLPRSGDGTSQYLIGETPRILYRQSKLAAVTARLCQMKFDTNPPEFVAPPFLFPDHAPYLRSTEHRCSRGGVGLRQQPSQKLVNKFLGPVMLALFWGLCLKSLAVRAGGEQLRINHNHNFPKKFCICCRIKIGTWWHIR